MMYIAAMSSHELTKQDFLFLAGHNQDYTGCFFKGRVELAGKTPEAEGNMSRLVYRLYDEQVECHDLMLVIAFSHTTEEIESPQDAYQFEARRRQPEIEWFLRLLVRNTRPESVDHRTTVNGNALIMLRNVDTTWLSDQFATLKRKTFKAV